MKKTPIRKVSKKQAKRNRELAKIPYPTDGRCENCGQLPDWRGLAKHHKKLRSALGRDDRSNLIWLCSPCHSAEHGIVELREG